MGLRGSNDDRWGSMRGRNCDDQYTRLCRCVCSTAKEEASLFLGWGYGGVVMVDGGV